MLIGYSQPAISGAVGITGGSWLTADGGAALFDRRPSRKARLQWGAGAPSIAQYVAITATFATATPPRFVSCAVGRSCSRAADRRRLSLARPQFGGLR